MPVSRNRLCRTFPAYGALAFASLLLTALNAFGQDQGDIYVGGALSVQGVDRGHTGIPEDGGRVATPAVAAWVGTTLGKGVALEVVFASASDAFDWTYSYIDATTENRATHRDLSLIGTLRFHASCRARACVEPLAGFGVARHHSGNVVTADCGSLANPISPCEQVSSSSPDMTFDHWGPTLLAGADVMIRVGEHVRAGPTARVEYVHHSDAYLFPDGANFRGPAMGGAWSFSIGGAIRWSK